MGRSSWKWLIAGCLLFGSMAPFAMAQEAEAATESAAELVPLRQAAESIGALVGWDQQTKTITVTYGDRVWTIDSASGRSEVNGTVVKLDAGSLQGKEKETRYYLAWSAMKEALQVQGNWVNGKVLADEADWKTRAAQFTVQWAALAEAPNEEAQLASLLTPELKEATKVAHLSRLAQQIIPMAGKPTQFVQASSDNDGVHQNVQVLFKTDKDLTLSLTLRYKENGLLNDVLYSYLPSGGYQPPAYDDASLYKEETIVIGDGQFKLPGTLTLPAAANASGTYPVLVLVHGSGANDRDESIGAAKTFRDMAIGLANEGIATIRYEKRTREYPVQSAAIPRFTVKEETVDDALLAVQWAGQDKRLNKDRIYVLGHSQGGMLIPKIVKADTGKAIRGAVIAAGPSGSIEDLMIEQMERQLQSAKDNKQPAEAIAAAEGQLKMWKQMVAIIKDEQYTLDNLPANFPLPNASWWIDFRNHQGGEIAKDQKVPLFIIQGDNDVQVGKEHLDGWKKALQSRTGVQYKLYPKLNHVFVESDKPSTGQEYTIPGNVPEQVMQDIAAWIRSN
ncbi:prolyl oligopeptidase family serine peptidase [Paenibacillus thiaminolyticus]|uniref:alpha/beta hydrolase family protein n=1 Tax=Paenibacillus thiaminolyticus TaxID=49283 RepID=UPI0011626648|nr:stalk domain-containing protein [Paenibacillus thiaminolyticus]NGP58276.1 prolyl oligopeptidase family serine peptidase [Paenibacillus thiaminolyticus]